MVFNQGDLNKYVYFVRSGEFKIIKQVKMPRLEQEIQDFAKFIENPAVVHERQLKKSNAGRIKQHVVGLISKGCILGLREAISTKAEKYTTGAVCSSFEAEVFKIDREIFIKQIQTQHTVWRELTNLGRSNESMYYGRIGKMQKSNLRIIETMKREEVQLEGQTKMLDVILQDIKRD